MSAASTLRPSSSPSKFSLPPPLPPPPSVGSLINISNLESYLQSIHTRLQSQDQVISSLQSSLSSSISLSSFSSFSSTLLSHIEAQERKIADMQTAIDHLTSQQSTITSHSTLLTQHSHQLASTPSTADLTSALSSLSSSLTTAIADVKGSTASLTSFHQLQSSLHMLLTQTSHLQTLMGDKVDRAELPLLEGVEARVKGMVDGMDALDVRVKGVEDDIRGLNKEMQGKESKEEVQRRLREVEEELEGKVGMDWLQEEVMDDLRAVQDELIKFGAHDETMRRIIEEQQQIHTRVTTHHTRVQSVNEDFESTQQRLDQLEGRVREKVDVGTWEKGRREDSKHVEQLLHQMTARTSQLRMPFHTHDFKVHAAYIAELRQQMGEQQTSASHHSDKLAVALKFIEWFTETKLQMA